MKLVRSTPKSLTFTLNDRERVFFVAVLRSYPALADNHQPLSRHSADHLTPNDESLLHEALAEHRIEHRAKIRRWLGGGSRFRQVDEEWQFRLARKDFNWMLQVLNEVRVGNWIQLGSPEDLQDPSELLHRDPTAFFHMEAAGLLQMELLHLTDL